jgi:hypothetical protein
MPGNGIVDFTNINKKVETMGNILDKTDKSLANAFGIEAKVDKVNRYNWVPANMMGEFRLIKKQDLNIDGRYQRGQVSSLKVRDIARDWNWVLFEALSVAEREDGTYWVLEGGHRTRASFYRSDVQLLPCMVFKVGSLSDEAKAFVCTNTMVSNVSPADKHRAGVVANEPTSQKVQALLDEFGLRPVSGGSSCNDAVMCVGAIRSMIIEDEELAARVVRFVVGLERDEPISGALLKGIFRLCKRFAGKVDILAEYGDKIALHSQRGLIIKINQFKAECGKGGEYISAQAILRDVINYKKQRRLTW